MSKLSFLQPGWLCSNPVNLWLTVNQAWIISATLLLSVLYILFPTTWQWVPLMIMSLLCVWFFGQGGSTVYWLWRSRKMGLRNLLVRPIPPDQFVYLADHQGISVKVSEPTLEVHTWTNCSYRKKGGIDQYQRDLEHDAARLARLAHRGELKYRVITCNSFNRYLLQSLRQAFLKDPFDVLQMHCYPKLVMVPCGLQLYREKSFAKIQRRMFGRVYSHRKVDVIDQWDLLIVRIGKERER